MHARKNTHFMYLKQRSATPHQVSARGPQASDDCAHQPRICVHLPSFVPGAHHPGNGAALFHMLRTAPTIAPPACKTAAPVLAAARFLVCFYEDGGIVFNLFDALHERKELVRRPIFRLRDASLQLQSKIREQHRGHSVLHEDVAYVYVAVHGNLRLHVAML